MDAQIVDILVCPACKGPLEKRLHDGALVCKTDRLAFPVRQGVAILLINQAETFEDHLSKGTA